MLDEIINDIVEETALDVIDEAVGPEEPVEEGQAIETPEEVEPVEASDEEEPASVEPVPEQTPAIDFGQLLAASIAPILEKLSALEERITANESMNVACGAVISDYSDNGTVNDPSIDLNETDDFTDLVLTPVEEWDLNI